MVLDTSANRSLASILNSLFNRIHNVYVGGREGKKRLVASFENNSPVIHTKFGVDSSLIFVFCVSSIYFVDFSANALIYNGH